MVHDRTTGPSHRRGEASSDSISDSEASGSRSDMLSKHESRKIRWQWRQATRARATVRAVVMHRRLRPQAGKKGATYSRGQPRQALVHRWAHALVMEVGLFCWPEEEKLLLACTRRPQGANKHRHGSVARTYARARKEGRGRTCEHVHDVLRVVLVHRRDRLAAGDPQVHLHRSARARGRPAKTCRMPQWEG